MLCFVSFSDLFLFFFFKQKTAYEMRISDWSSDVCSSDLLITILNPRVRNKRIFQELVNSIAHLGLKKPITVSQRPGKTRFDLVCGQGRLEACIALGQTERSEERRVGKEWVSTGRSRWST